jgi:hypothetical protein
VKAQAKDKEAVHVTSDDDGDFVFPNLKPGKWRLVALDENSFPSSAVEIDLKVDTPDVNIELLRLAGTDDQQAGRRFFTGTMISFLLVVVLYVVLHLFLLKGPKTGFTFWSRDPLRLLEIMFWGLAGILINKIILVSWYLRSRRFYKEGTIMHFAHIVATPFLVLVAVLILSLVNLQITLADGNKMILDLSDPNIMVAFAFIIGTSPWPLWRFVENAGKRFTSQFD